jgi:hypothetical protein
LSAAAGAKNDLHYAKGTRYWFLVEVFPENSEPAQQIAPVAQGSAVGFTFRESGRFVAVLHNPTGAATACPLSLPASTTSLTFYEDNSGKGRVVAQRPASVDLAPQRHLLVVGAVESGR